MLYYQIVTLFVFRKKSDKPREKMALPNSLRHSTQWFYWVNPIFIVGVSLSFSSKFSTSDGGGDSNVEWLWRSATFRVVGDKEFVGNGFLYGLADTVTFVAHDDDAIGWERLFIYIVPFKEGAVDGDLRCLLSDWTDFA